MKKHVKGCSLLSTELFMLGCHLAHKSTIALILIGLAGDVASNPGPEAPCRYYAFSWPKDCPFKYKKYRRQDGLT